MISGSSTKICWKIWFTKVTYNVSPSCWDWCDLKKQWGLFHCVYFFLHTYSGNIWYHYVIHFSHSMGDDKDESQTPHAIPTILAYGGVGYFCVNPRFHPTDVWQYVGLTQKILTSTYVYHNPSQSPILCLSRGLMQAGWNIKGCQLGDCTCEPWPILVSQCFIYKYE